MKRILISIAIAAALGAPEVKAADLSAKPVKAPAAVAVPAPQIPAWAGAYVGAYAGYLSAGGEYTMPATGEFHFLDPKGFSGGLLAGYAMQAGRWVYGLEADVGYVGAKETRDTGFPANPTATQLSTEFLWNAHVRGRIGYGFDHVLLFATGGLAVAGIEHSAIDNVAGATATWSSTRAGWSVGGGAEVRVNARTSVRLEYVYDNYGNETLGARTVGAVNFADREHKLDSHTLRAAVNFRF